MKRNSGYFFFCLIIIVAIIVSTNIWVGIKNHFIQNYIEESGYNLLSDDEIEEIKDKAYQEGHDEGYDEGYENALTDYNVAGEGVTWATVYYTDNGDCYHMNPSCLSLRDVDRNKIHEVSLEVLAHNGSSLRPCDICVPHSYD